MYGTKYRHIAYFGFYFTGNNDKIRSLSTVHQRNFDMRNPDLWIRYRFSNNISVPVYAIERYFCCARRGKIMNAHCQSVGKKINLGHCYQIVSKLQVKEPENSKKILPAIQFCVNNFYNSPHNFYT
jgi:hypothetical protein